MIIMKLTEAPVDKEIKILKIEAENEVKKRLNAMGIHINDYLMKLNKSGTGPVLIQNITNNASKIALGNDLAEKILVVA
jgi:Fe2+ transport system protein FeoA